MEIPMSPDHIEKGDVTSVFEQPKETKRHNDTETLLLNTFPEY